MQKPCKCKKNVFFFVHNPHSSLCTTLISQTPRIIINRITYSDVKFNFQLIGTIPRLLRLTVFEIQPFSERGSFLSIFRKIKNKRLLSENWLYFGHDLSQQSGNGLNQSEIKFCIRKKLQNDSRIHTQSTIHCLFLFLQHFQLKYTKIQQKLYTL